jgi:hypothetical protein
LTLAPAPGTLELPNTWEKTMADGPDAAARARFESEVSIAGLEIPNEDREITFLMWADMQKYRDTLRAAEVELPLEPTFMQKPCMPGGGA